jgi:hypothetical protein
VKRRLFNAGAPFTILAIVALVICVAFAYGCEDRVSPTQRRFNQFARTCDRAVAKAFEKPVEIGRASPVYLTPHLALICDIEDSPRGPVGFVTIQGAWSANPPTASITRRRENFDDVQEVAYFLEFREANGKWRFVRALEEINDGDAEMDNGTELYARLVQVGQALEKRAESESEKPSSTQP